MSRPALVSAIHVPSGVEPFGLRRECGTAPGGATRPSRPLRALHAAGGSLAAERQKEVQALLMDETWFADVDAPLDDGLDFDDCPSPTLFLNDHPAGFGDAVDTDEADAAAGGAAADAAAAYSGEARAGAPTGQRFAANSESTPRGHGGLSRTRIEGRMNLSPRESFERGGKKKASRSQNGNASHDVPDALKGLLNSKDLEDRLASAQAHMRLMIPSPNVSSLELERPPSRQRNLPMHLNSDLSLELPSHVGLLSPDVERKWAHYASTPRPQSRHKSPPDAVFLDLPPEPLQGDRDPQPLAPDQYIEHDVDDLSYTEQVAAASVFAVPGEGGGADGGAGAASSVSAAAAREGSAIMPPPPQLLSTPYVIVQSSASTNAPIPARVASRVTVINPPGGTQPVIGPQPVIIACCAGAALGSSSPVFAGGGMVGPSVGASSGALPVDLTGATPRVGAVLSMSPPLGGAQVTSYQAKVHQRTAQYGFVDRASLLAAAASPHGSVDALEGDFERLEMMEPNISVAASWSGGGTGAVASTSLRGARSVEHALSGGGDGPPKVASLQSWMERRAASRPDSPSVLSRPQSGQFRACSLAGSPRGSAPPTRQLRGSCAQTTPSQAAAAPAPAANGSRSITSCSSHAHARAHQQQMEAVSRAASAASTSFDGNGNGTASVMRPSPSYGRYADGAAGGASVMACAPAPAMTSAAQAPPGTTRTLSGVTGLTGGGGAAAAAERMEVLSSSGSRPSTSESDASARGPRPAYAKDVARVQKLDKLSAMYGGVDGAHATHAAHAAHAARGGAGATPATGSEGRTSGRPKAGSAGAERHAGSCYGSTGSAYGASSMAAELRRSVGRPSCRNGCSTAPTTVGANPRVAQREAAAAALAAAQAAGGGGPPEPTAERNYEERAVLGATRYAGRGLVSPLPFESSLAPDFLALFSQ